MDAVPDSVFICDNNTDNSNSAIYANRKMNAFFGRDVVSTNKEVSSTNKKKSWLKSVKIDGAIPNAIENDPLKMRIFTRKNVSEI